MDQQFLQASAEFAGDGAILDQLLHERDGTHLGHQRAAEGDLVQPVGDFGIAARDVLARRRVDFDHHHVGAFAVVDEGPNRRVAAEAAVPIGFAFDLDGVVDIGQAGRCQQGVDRKLFPREDANLAGPHVGGGDECLDLVAGVHSLRIEVTAQQIAQWIELQRVALPWRERALDEVGP